MYIAVVEQNEPVLPHLILKETEYDRQLQEGLVVVVFYS